MTKPDSFIFGRSCREKMSDFTSFYPTYHYLYATNGHESSRIGRVLLTDLTFEHIREYSWLRVFLSQQIDPVRQHAGAEAVVDVHDRHAGGAGIQHREERG